MRTAPEPTTLTRTPTGAKSTAKPLVRPSSAATTPDVADIPGLGLVSKDPIPRLSDYFCITFTIISYTCLTSESAIPLGGT